VGHFGGCDEELAAVGVGAGIGHCQLSCLVERQTSIDFILEMIPWIAGALAFRVPTLNHEAIDNSVENKAIVEPPAGQEDEVVDGDWSLARKQLYLYVAVVGTNSGCDFS